MNIRGDNQTRLVIVGATGMVGGYALRYMLDHPGIACVTVYRAQEARNLVPQALRGSASGLFGLLCTR